MKKQNQKNNNNKNNNQRNKNKPLPKRNAQRPMNQIVKTNDIGDQLSSVVKNGYGKTLSMYPSCVDFARVYADPFSTIGARIPELPLLPSKLVRFSYSGTSVISN
jgi:hypothetical protein